MRNRLVLLAVVCLVTSNAVGAQGTVTLTAGSSPNMQVAPGGILSVPLILDMSQANGGAVQNLAGTLTWNPAAITLDSVVSSAFGAATLNLASAPSGIATYSIAGSSAVSATTTVGTLYFTAASSQAGSRLQVTISTATNPIGALSLGYVLTRNAEICVAPFGLWGDSNGDASVDIIDAQQIARYTIGLSIANPASLTARGDVNADTHVDIIDAQQIARYSVSLPAAARVATNLFSPPSISSVVVNRSTFNLTNGLQVLLAGTPRDASGQAILGCNTIVWSSSNPAIATVNAAGLVRGVAAGSTTVTATVNGQIAQSTITVVDPDTTAALIDLRNMTAGNPLTVTVQDGGWMLGGLLADEWKSSDTFSQRNNIDQRVVADNDAQVAATLRVIYKARSDARGAMIGLIASGAPASHRARMYFIMGYAELMLAENFCNGAYLNSSSTGLMLNAPQVTNAQLYALAIAHFDSALVLATAPDAFTVSVKNLTTVAKGRALIETGSYATAIAVVNAVPTSYVDSSTLITGENNKIWVFNTSQKRFAIGDTTGGLTGTLPFRTANDSRLPVTNSGFGFDAFTPFSFQSNWQQTTVAPIYTGIDARLIAAEANFMLGNSANAQAILNSLRVSAQQLGAVTSTAFAPLTGLTLSTLFFERAFWTFGRGQRLGDLRRLMRLNGQVEASTFPTGNFHKGGVYGTIKNLPANVDEDGNSVQTVCIDRNP